MESRKITIVSTKEQTKKVIMSTAETLAEFKKDLDNNGINYTDMTFYEGLTKTELISDNSILPKDVLYKNTITNELVFMLTNTNKKISSGCITRKDAYDSIQNLGLKTIFAKKYGRSYTTSTTKLLIEFIEEEIKSRNKEKKDNGSDEKKSTSSINILNSKYNNELLELLSRNYELSNDIQHLVNIILNSTKITDRHCIAKEELQSSYNDEELKTLLDRN